MENMAIMKRCVSLVILLPLIASVPLQDQLKLEAVDKGYLFQGDMVMSREEIETAVHGGDTDNVDGNAFGLQKRTWYRWPKAEIPYVFSSSVKNPVLGKLGPTVRAIRSAMKEWEEKTCVRFVERTDQRDYVEFIDGGFGKCYSHVGRIGGKQKLSLGFGCFTHGVALHEIGHALGLHHEQSRPDRDQYVEIIWDHIKEANKFNFRKYSHSKVDSRGSPYDYDSIMHYEWNAFAKWPWQTTIRAKKSGVSFGQRSYVSGQDAKQINTFYECPKKTFL